VRDFDRSLHFSIFAVRHFNRDPQKDPHLIPLRPALWPEKFPEQRGKRVTALITPEIQERINKQDAAGRLVFDGE